MTKTALITGAADRIGAALATRLAAEGYAVIVHYNRSADKANALVANLNESGARGAAIGADLCDRKARESLISRATEFFGSLDVLVNNASTFEPDSIATLREDYWDMHMRVHAEAPIFLARDFAAQLASSSFGNIINIVDERVLHLTPDYFSYTLSKATLHAATRTLAQSLAPHIRVNAIAPGPTLRNTRQTADQFAQSQASLPLEHGPSPDEIAQTLINILNMPNLTGQTLAIDGGEHLAWTERSKITPRL